MSKDPAFLFYPGDWLGGTMGMTLEEKGAYIELLVFQFNKGKFTEKDIMHMHGGSLCKHFAGIKEKFAFDGVYYYNQRLIDEVDKRRKYSESRRNNAQKRWKKDDAHACTHAMRMEDENENENEDVINLNKIKKTKNLYDEDFESFWKAYPKKRGKKTALKAWNKIKPSQQLQAMIAETLEAAKKCEQWAKEGGQFIPHPSTWLNSEGWLDDYQEKPRFAGMERYENAIF